MQVQLDDIASADPLLREVGKEEFVGDVCPCDPNRALLFEGLDALQRSRGRARLGPHWHWRTVVEAAHQQAFRALLELIGGRCRRAWTSG